MYCLPASIYYNLLHLCTSLTVSYLDIVLCAFACILYKTSSRPLTVFTVYYYWEASWFLIDVLCFCFIVTVFFDSLTAGWNAARVFVQLAISYSDTGVWRNMWTPLSRPCCCATLDLRSISFVFKREDTEARMTAVFWELSLPCIILDWFWFW